MPKASISIPNDIPGRRIYLLNVSIAIVNGRTSILNGSVSTLNGSGGTLGFRFPTRAALQITQNPT